MFNGLFNSNSGGGCNCTWIILIILFICCCCGGGSGLGCGKRVNIGLNPCYLLLALGLLYCCGGITVGTC